jgi:ion channel-forming bestrophin family protein
MYIGKKLAIQGVWFFARKNIIFTALLSSTVVVLYHFWRFTFLGIPFLPVSTIGTAVAFYVGFKNNQAYDRLWEARRLWGGFTNTSRTFAASFISLVKDKAVQKEVLFRHIGYLNMVRLQLRKNIPWATGHEDYHRQVISEAAEIQEYHQAVKDFFVRIGKLELYEEHKDKGNIANLALQYQFDKVTSLKREKVIDDFEHSDLTNL